VLHATQWVTGPLTILSEELKAAATPNQY